MLYTENIKIQTNVRFSSEKHFLCSQMRTFVQGGSMTDSLQLLEKKKLNQLCYRYHLALKKTIGLGSGFTQNGHDCLYYTDRIEQEERYARHYAALVKLSERGLTMVKEEHRRILVDRYVKKQSANDMINKYGYAKRTYFRRQSEAVRAFRNAVKHLLKVHQKISAAQTSKTSACI